jgi:GTP cyclohydrolase I
MDGGAGVERPGRRARIEAAVREILDAVGEDPEREGLRGTPTRIADLYGEIFGGLGEDPVEALSGGFEEGHQELVVLKDIPFYSMCEHHLLPFYGVAHIGYIPKGRVVGIGRIAHVVEILARRPQLQERLTTQVADTMVKGIQPQGVAVVVEATHLCMTMRGVKKPNALVVTSAMRGIFHRSPATRAEFMALIKGG